MSILKRVLVTGAILTLSLFQITAETIHVFGEGDGVDTATAVRNALKSALEQTYGTFISSDTEIFNDEVVADDIVSLQFGNVQSYKIISESGDSIKTVFVEAVIDRDRLAQYARSKGSQAELAGDVFAMNLKLAQFNIENIDRTLEKLMHHLGKLSETMYDYKLVVDEPIVDGDNVFVPIAVKCYLTKDAYTFFKTTKDVRDAIDKAIKSNRVNGRFDSPELQQCLRWMELLPHIQRVACYNFILKDNIGNTVKTESEEYDNHGRRLPYVRRPDTIYFQYGRFKGNGINIMNLNEANISHRNTLGDYLYNLTLRWNSNPYSYYGYLIDGLIEVPYESTRNKDNTSWFNERYAMYPQQFKPGALNGTIRMFLVYNVNQISKLKKIEVYPDISQ